MRPIIFVILHSIILLVVLITPQFIIFSPANTDTNVNRLLGLTLIGISLIVAVELSVISASLAVNQRTGQIIRVIWGFIMLPAALLSVADSGLYRSIGSHIDVSTIRYALAHIGELAPLVNSEIKSSAWAIIILAIILSLGLSIIGWKITSPRTHRACPLTTLAISLLFLVGASANVCSDTNQDYLDTSYNLTNLACRRTTSNNQQKTISNITNLKIAQLNQQSTTNSDIITPIDKLLSSLPVKLQTTADSTLDNIVIIILEATRADATTPYNPELDTTPFLDKIAKTGMKVSDGYTNHAYTSKSLVAVPCGIPPNPRLANTENKPNGIPQLCLPELLKTLGYTSAFFQSATQTFENRKGLVKNLGFNTFVPLEKLDRTGWKTVNYFGIEEKALIKPIMKWVDKQNNPFLLTTLTLSSHHPFQPLASFPKKEYAGGQKWSDYLNTVRYVDTFLQELFSEFDQRGLLENTLFVFTGDHGATLDSRDHRYPYQENIHVPIILWSKHLIPKPMVIAGPRQHTDIVPTIVDLLGLKIAQGTFYGLSLREPTNNRTIPIVCKFAICLGRITNQFKFFRYNDQRSPDLYDPAEDPKDTNNLAQLIPKELTKSYSDELEAWKKKVIQLYENQQLAQRSDVRGIQSNITLPDTSLVDARLEGNIRPGKSVKLTAYLDTPANPNEKKYELELVNTNGLPITLTVQHIQEQEQTDPYTEKRVLMVEFDFSVPTQATQGANQLLIKIDPGETEVTIPAWIN